MESPRTARSAPEAAQVRPHLRRDARGARPGPPPRRPPRTFPAQAPVRRPRRSRNLASASGTAQSEPSATHGWGSGPANPHASRGGTCPHDNGTGAAGVPRGCRAAPYRGVPYHTIPCQAVHRAAVGLAAVPSPADPWEDARGTPSSSPRAGDTLPLRSSGSSPAAGGPKGSVASARPPRGRWRRGRREAPPSAERGGGLAAGQLLSGGAVLRRGSGAEGALSLGGLTAPLPVRFGNVE